MEGKRKTMLRINCPHCGQYSYTAAVESFLPCNFCGKIFSGKHGPEKRKEPREKRQTLFYFIWRGRPVKAQTFDCSEQGLGIEVFKPLPLTVGQTLNFTMEEVPRKGKVTWVNIFPQKVVAGLNVAGSP
jgi:hypothetical protein